MKVVKVLWGYIWRILGILIFVLDIIMLCSDIINPKQWINK